MNIKRRPAPIGRRRRGRSFKTERPPGVNGARRRRAPGKSLARGRARVLIPPRGAERGDPPAAGGRRSRGGVWRGIRSAEPRREEGCCGPPGGRGKPPGSRWCVRFLPRSRQGPVPLSVGLFAGPATAVRNGKGAESKIKPDDRRYTQWKRAAGLHPLVQQVKTPPRLAGVTISNPLPQSG